MPRQHLSREKIITVALQIADTKGLEAVTLRGIAKQLQVHVTSLYNHIPTKEAVFAEMMKALVAEAELPVDSLAWQDWVKRFAVAMRTLARRHPGAFQLFQRGPAQGEQAAESLESAIAAFRSDGFDAVSTFYAVKATSVFVLGLVLDDLARHQFPTIQAEPSQQSMDRFPFTREILDVVDNGDSFHILLDAFIKGMSPTCFE